MKALKLIGTLVAGLLLVSCESNTYSEISGTATEHPTYEANIKPIITTNCIECHSVGGEKQDFPLETYDQVVAASESISCHIDGKFCVLMPPTGRIPQSQIDTFNLWIAQGFVQQ